MKIARISLLCILNTRSGFIALYLTLEHLVYSLSTSKVVMKPKVDMKPCYHLNISLLLFIKFFSNQLFENSSFSIKANESWYKQCELAPHFCTEQILLKKTLITDKY